ncbi:GNAT family N-acetyltransferase [Streptomyces sp. SID3212]|uniref:GNAT family N-acetyltransferase n=1 Tax=Streptomyces sp. SID3212 TaxID=2690259 RepID=UPI00136E91D2|nr:GNAT family N-acetyltransferase [Streptomyces sp. SID3212]MYV54275.1 GNAT family N-acetyltransferase [Streptomyces sp. SID3212]
MTDFGLVHDPSRWQEGFERRLRAAYDSAGHPAAAAERRIEEVRADEARRTVAELTSDGGGTVGWVAVSLDEDEPGSALTGRIVDLWIDPAHRGRGHGEAARTWAEDRCAAAGATRLTVQLTEADPLFAHYSVRGQTRLRHLAGPARDVTPPPEATPAREATPGRAAGPALTSRPMTADEYGPWLVAGKDEYVADIVRSGSLTPDEARAKSDRDFADLLPAGPATPDHNIVVLEAAGAPVGTLWLKHHHLPGVTFGFSLEIDENRRGEGFGHASMAVAENETLGAGDSVLMFNVFGGNTVAMGLYDVSGYRVVLEHRYTALPREAPDAGL